MTKKKLLQLAKKKHRKLSLEIKRKKIKPICEIVLDIDKNLFL